MNAATDLPYELHAQGAGAFVIFKVADQIALPLIALVRATLRTTRENDEVALQFQTTEIVIEGRALAPMLDHLLGGRVKRISRGRDCTCSINVIRIMEVPSSA